MLSASDYVVSLSGADQKQYMEKLHVYGAQRPDPYTVPESEWVQGAEGKRRCPPVKMSNVVVYLLFSPSKFTAENVENYKALEAYNYFESGLVRKCRLWRPGDVQISFVRAEVMPSQTAAAKGHDTWVCVNDTSGQILAGHCQCKAGLGEVCSHVAALLFVLEAAARERADVSCTSQPCAWHAAVSKKATMVPVDQLNLSKPGRKARKLAAEANHTSETYDARDIEIFQRLRKASSSAVVLRSIPKTDSEDTDSASEDEEMYTFLRNARKARSTKEDFLEDMFLPLSEIERIEKATRLTSKSPLWHEARYGRLTGTTMHRIRTLKADTNVQGLLDSVLQRRPPLNIEAVRWGADKEKVAKEQYLEFMKARHANFELHEIGFVIDTDAPFLGATPDGLWHCSCHGVGLLEIKCPWSLKEPHHQVLEASYLSASGTLLETHTYFTQVQTQLHVCRKAVCHFVVWLPHQFGIVEVPYSSHFFKPLLEKARAVWAEHVLPALL
ncbi:uncharacterized protein LOC144116327 [Amblyomma americanum]